jgi:transcriptional regulator with XRE-family HTH domain
MKVPDALGGKRLRALREYRGKTQLEVELDASLGIGYLQRLESGRVKLPERDTLDRILLALNAHYTERREVLELFGYIVDAPIPGEEEVQWAVAACQAELNSAAFPAYLLDCAHRLLCWNTFVPRLLDTPFITGSRIEGHHVSMLKMVFDPFYEMTSKISNSDVFFPAQIRALRYEMQRFQDEAWYGSLIEDMLQCSAFERHWIKEGSEQIHIPARPLTPLEIWLEDRGPLRFRLISEPFVQDHRFRVIYYLPADHNTIKQCLDWLASEARCDGASHASAP